MDNTILLAHIFSIYLAITGIYLLFNRQQAMIHINVMLDKEHVLWLISFFTTFLGSVLVCLHNIWVLGWPVVITLLAWIMLAKGVSGVFAPACFKKLLFMYQNKTFYYIISVFCIVLAVFLAVNCYLLVRG